MKPQQMVSANTNVSGDADGRKVGLVWGHEASRSWFDMLARTAGRHWTGFPMFAYTGINLGGYGRVGGRA